MHKIANLIVSIFNKILYPVSCILNNLKINVKLKHIETAVNVVKGTVAVENTSGLNRIVIMKVGREWNIAVQLV